jgi:hypothetical protein
MKTLVLIAAAFISANIACHAGVIDKLLGTWSGTGHADGSILVQRHAVVYQSYENTGMLSTTTIRIQGYPKQTGVLRYHKNGKLEGDLKANGKVIATIKGSWTQTATTLTTTTTARGIFPTISQKSVLKLSADSNKSTTKGRTSTGNTSKVYLTRQ